MILPRLRIGQGTDPVRRQLTALWCTTLEFKRLSKHYASESHNNDQRSNKRHKVRETGSEWERKKKKASKGETKKRKIEGKKDGREKINRLLYAATRICPLAAPDSLSKDSNSQQTNWTSIHRPILIICHPSLSLSPFISFFPPQIHTHTSTYSSKFNTLIWLRAGCCVIDVARGLIHLEPGTRL